MSSISTTQHMMVIIGVFMPALIATGFAQGDGGFELVAENQTCEPSGNWFGGLHTLEECFQKCPGGFVHATAGDKNCKCTNPGCVQHEEHQYGLFLYRRTDSVPNAAQQQQEQEQPPQPPQAAQTAGMAESDEAERRQREVDEEAERHNAAVQQQMEETRRVQEQQRQEEEARRQVEQREQEERNQRAEADQKKAAEIEAVRIQQEQAQQQVQEQQQQQDRDAADQAERNRAAMENAQLQQQQQQQKEQEHAQQQHEQQIAQQQQQAGTDENLTPEQQAELKRREDAVRAIKERHAAEQAAKQQEMERLRAAAATPPPVLTQSQIFISGRIGVNQLINGVFEKRTDVYHGRPSYHKLKSSETPQHEAVDMAVWWSSGKWYVGLVSEIGSDAAYAFVPSQAGLPHEANSVWSIWDGSRWLADAHIKCSGPGPRNLHVGAVDEEQFDDDQYQEYLREREDEMKRRGTDEEEAYNYDEDDEPVAMRNMREEKKESTSRNPEDGTVPEAVPGKAPKRVKYMASCPEGHPGCSPYNLCRSCPAECETCQNLRTTDASGQCVQGDCFTCHHGYTHKMKHTEGRGTCTAVSSGTTPYILAGGVAVGLVAIVIFYLCRDDRRPARKRGLLPSFGS